ncbi:hypothetical protein BTO06_06395 [Tenacibaculum sp. SZ-18]|uniref:hypothetical protein n=1 Tax=Tenacibaculum sp. SZ-18 TaxID=754423 RepID=UPI000C2CF617|nr:hypothetical protein [Tenacibaculum sp. SZ-18]AUC14794.1 hypothetical protein BTO06_06395 [Tenacibaculum sp. SZ-18]
MKNNILNFGKTLSKVAQQEITGGRFTIIDPRQKCIRFCKTAMNGERCQYDHCGILVCDGNGGYNEA